MVKNSSKSRLSSSYGQNRGGMLSMSRSHPSGLSMGSTDSEQRLGLAVLTALSIASVHSSVCPSYFTMATFASQPEARQRAMDGLWISLGLSSLASFAIYAVWKDWTAALVGGATSLAMFGIGVYAINQKPPEGIPAIDKQNTTKPI